ncbi:helix-turn-helix domain-containing protein [Sporosarcina sp. D27]|uniref:helix-turn-helix domain-containing protein n=1 Tax=Sporosarcina sp. D27 TaxID=1382305 RepID=UPI00046F3AEF|nr:helix-turn-helix domain-containing protein [Sporosarcina sp. D27]
MNKTYSLMTDSRLYKVLSSAVSKIMDAVGNEDFEQSIVNEILHVIPQLDVGFLLIFNDKTQKLIVKHAVGYDKENYRKTQLTSGEGISGEVFGTGEPMFLTTQQDITLAMRSMSPINLSHYLHSTTKADYPQQTIAIPLKDTEGTLGVITLSSHDNNSHYPSNFMDILHSFTPMISLAYRHHVLKKKEVALEKELLLTAKALRKEHDQQQKTADLYNELTTLSNQNKGIQTMMLAFQHYITAPISLYDELFNRIADVNQAPTLLPPGFISTKEVQYVISMKKWQVYNQTDETSIIIIPIVGSNSVIGFLLTYIEKEKFHHVDRMLLEYGSSLISLEMMKQQSILEAQRVIYGDLFEKIIFGASDSQLDQQAKNLGFQPEDFYVALICSEIEHNSKKDNRFEREKWMRWIEEALKLYKIKGIVTQRGDQVIAFLSFPEVEGKISARKALTNFTEYLNKVNFPVYIGLGRMYESFHDIRKSYGDAEKSLLLLKKRKNRRVHKFSDGGIYRILLDFDNKELETFLEDHLGALLDYENKKNGDLLETLIVYVENNRNLKNTIDALTIHQNTLYYRVKRIEEILDISLANPEQWFDIQLACKIYEYVYL